MGQPCEKAGSSGATGAGRGLCESAENGGWVRMAGFRHSWPIGFMPGGGGRTTGADLGAFVDSEFDVVIHPVSTCYVPDVRPVFQEVARVLRTCGLYISQHKQPVSLQASIEPVEGAYRIELPYSDAGPLLLR